MISITRRIFGMLSLAVMVFATSVCRGQQLPTASPESVGLSSERLQRIAAAVDESIKNQQIAGAVTMVIRHGKVAWLKPQGSRDRGAGKGMPPERMFRFFS